MFDVRAVYRSSLKTKHKALLVAKILRDNKEEMARLMEFFDSCLPLEKDFYMEVLETISQDNPDIFGSYIGFIIECLTHDSPKVRCEASRIMTNIASKFPFSAIWSVPGLLVNAFYQNSLVRMSAALALVQIAKHNPAMKELFTQEFNNILAKETNNGIKSIYMKAIETPQEIPGAA